jgi:hypothetical protein
VTPRAYAVLLTAVLMTSPAAAQTRTVEPSSAPLSAEKQAVVKEYVRQAKVPEAQADGRVTVGMTVPEEVEPWALPQDSVTEVPTVTSYKFFYAGKTIAVVDAVSRKVIQVIPN